MSIEALHRILASDPIDKRRIHGGGPVNKHQVKGTIDEVMGTAKRKAGELTDNTRLQVEGMAQQAKGKLENAWGSTKDAMCNVIAGSELHLDAHVKLGSTHSTANAERQKSE
jgi:uncharacterized protein YjbJ (UPF0337 family)